MEYSDDAQLSLRHLSPSSHLAKKCHDAFAITRVDLGSEYSLQISGSSCLNNDWASTDHLYTHHLTIQHSTEWAHLDWGFPSGTCP